jgi:WD40 repeat protein
VAFSPDGRLVVAGSEDGFATIWDSNGGREVRRLPEQHEDTAISATFSGDGRWLATGSWAGVLRIWDVRTGQLLHRIRAHRIRVSAVAFSPDDRCLATAGFDRTVKVWDAGTGEPLQTLSGHSGVVSGLAWGHDGKRLFSCGTEDKTVKMWDPATGREILDLRGHKVACHCVSVSSGGKRLASSGGDGTIRIWDATRPQEKEGPALRSLAHESEVWSTEFSSNGHYLASGVWTGPVHLRDARTGALLHTLAQSDDIITTFHVAFSPDSQRLAAAAMARDRTAVVKIWETTTGREVGPEIREKGVGFFVAFDPTGKFLIREGPEHTIQIRDARSGAQVGVLGCHDRQIWGAAFSPDARLVSTASNDGTVRVWSWNPEHLELEQAPKLTLPVHVGGYGNRVAFTQDSLFLITGGERQTVKIWSAQTGENVMSLQGHTGDVFSIGVSHDGRWLATAGEDTTVRVWDTSSWALKYTLRGHVSLVGALAFSPDNRRLASASRDYTLKIWDINPATAP